jgi:putative ABC transport system permease protein
MFPIPILAGDMTKALDSNDNIAISHSYAEKLGGVEACLGKVIVLNSWGDKVNYIVEAVFEDLPANGTFSFDMVYSNLSYKEKNLHSWQIGAWNGYVKLQKGIDPHSLDEAIYKMQEAHQDLEKMKTEGDQIRYYLTPFDKLHTSDPDVRNTVIVLSIVAFLLIFISLMNYILVVLSSMVKRSKEIGVRKCYGAGSREIYGMLLKEAALHIGLALLLAVLLILAGSDLITNLLGISFATMLVGKSIRTILAVIMLIFILSVIVPGFLYTRIPVWQAIRIFTLNMRHWKLFLLSLQVAVNVFIMAMLLVVTAQYEHMASEDTGYNYKNLYYIDTRENLELLNRIVDKLASAPEVKGVEGCATMPYLWAEGNVVLSKDGRTTLVLLADGYMVTDGFYDLLEIPFISGTQPADSSQVAISENLIEKMMEFEDWSDGAVGKQIVISDHSYVYNADGKFVGFAPFTISGVYRDIRIGSALDPNLKPSCFFKGDFWSRGRLHNMRFLLVKVERANSKTMQKIQDAVNEVSKGEEQQMEVKSYADEIRAQYSDSRKMRNIILVGALFALLISLIGLIGYVSDEANRRSKEIAVRKVHGAVSGEIVRMFVSEVLKLSLVAAVVGAVGSFFVARKWLEQFAFRISASPWYFVGAALIILIIVGIVIGISSYRIAKANPAVALKKE